MTELRVENLHWQGARLGEENPQPLFREKQVDRQVPVRESVPPDKRQRAQNTFVSGKRYGKTYAGRDGGWYRKPLWWTEAS